MVSHPNSTQVPLRQELPNSSHGNRRGTPVPTGPGEDQLFDVRKGLCDISYITRDVYNALARHQCNNSSTLKAYEQAYQQEHQKLKEAVGTNKSLGKMNERLRLEADYYKTDSDTMRSRLQERDATVASLTSRVERLDKEKQHMKEVHEEALRNAADRIVSQDHKIDELLAHIEEMVPIEGQSPTSQVASPGKRRREGEDEQEAPQKEDGKKEEGETEKKSRKRRQTRAVDEGQAESPSLE